MAKIDLESFFSSIKKSSVKDTEPVKDIDESEVYILIDLDNIQWNKIRDVDKFGVNVNVIICADTAHKATLKSNNMSEFEGKIKGSCTKIECEVGKNSTDFRLVYEATSLLVSNKVKYLYIISGDKGYDLIIKHMQEQYAGKIKAIERFEDILPCIFDYKMMSVSTEDDVKTALNQLCGKYRKDMMFEQIKSCFT